MNDDTPERNLELGTETQVSDNAPEHSEEASGIYATFPFDLTQYPEALAEVERLLLKIAARDAAIAELRAEVDAQGREIRRIRRVHPEYEDVIAARDATIAELRAENANVRDRLDLSMLQVQEKQSVIKALTAENERLMDVLERELTIGEDR